MLIVGAIIFLFAVSIYSFIIPKVDENILSLEEKNAKLELMKISSVVSHDYENLESFQQNAINEYKNKLQASTEMVWSLMNTKLIQTKSKYIEKNLAKKAEVFEQILHKIYRLNKKRFDEKALKKRIASFIKAYRYEEGFGYFYAKTAQKNISNIDNSSNRKIHTKQNSKIFYSYQGKNPKTDKKTTIYGYEFVFEPLGWTIGTGLYLDSLKSKLQEELFVATSRLRHGKGNYFFITDYDGNILMDPYFKGKNLLEAKDFQGNSYIADMIELATYDFEGFYNYWWKRKSGDQEVYEKIAFVKDFPGWEMVVGTSMYVEDIQEEVTTQTQELKSNIAKLVDEITIAKTGYITIFDKMGKSIIAPKKAKSQSDIPKDLLKKFKNRKNLNISQYTQKNSYLYVKFIEGFDWYVVATVPIDELKLASKSITSTIISVALVVLVLSLLFSTLFFRKLLLPISKLSKVAKRVSKGDLKARAEVKSSDEVGVLAQSFNEMIVTIEQNIEEIEYEKIYQEAIFNSVDSLLFVTNGMEIVKVNETFMKFFDQYEDIEEFKNEHDCVCEFFETDEKGEYITQSYQGLSWFEYILKYPEQENKVQITKNGQTHYFLIKIDKINLFEKVKYVVVLTDISELVTFRENLLQMVDSQTKELKVLHRELQDSIDYSSKIQQSILPKTSVLESFFSDYCMLYNPKDVVGGDIVLFQTLRNEDEALLMVIDCTGHGVPGAFVTMIVKAIEREIVSRLIKSDYDIDPSLIMAYFNKTMRTLLVNNEQENSLHAGFEGGIVYINKDKNILRYCGSQTPLFVVQDEKVKYIKGDRHSIGYKSSDPNFKFTQHSVDITKPTQIFLSTDGYFEQTGGKKGLMFGKRRFQRVVQDIQFQDSQQQQTILQQTIQEYKQGHDTKDDLTVVCARIN